MRRISLGLTMAGLLAVAMSAPTVGQKATSAATYMSDDGLVTIVVPDGSALGDVSITISLRAPEDAPPELADLPGPPAQYLIEPEDVVFDPPATLLRRVPLATLKRAADQPLPMGILASRDADGDWAWLAAPGFRVDAPAEVIELTGEIAQGGGVFAFVAGVITSGVATPQAGGIEQVLVPETTFNVPVDLRAAVTDTGDDDAIAVAAGSTGDATVATAGEALTSSLFGDLVVSQPFECVAPGETSIESTFTIESVAADNPVASQLGLPATPVEVTIIGGMVCIE